MSTTLIERLERHHRNRRGQPRRPRPRRRPSPQSLAQARRSPTGTRPPTRSARLEKLIQRGTTEVLVGAEAIIDEARNGRMFILVDDDDRENEGDLVIPAQMATPDAINFMARHGRGLICLALDQGARRPARPASRWRAPTAAATRPPSPSRSRRSEGITTGISAADRARTIAVAIDAANGPDAIVSPGHVFPLVARPGGVLVRAGHTEAAVDVARLAGLNPSA